VLREIRRVLPAEDLIYLADSAYTPYGDRPAAVIIERSIAMVTLLEREGVKAVVVACNTATGVAVEALRARFAIPIVAIEPAVKPAAARTVRASSALLAATQTLASERFSTGRDTCGRRARRRNQRPSGRAGRRASYGTDAFAR
jgi:glutamate racemase